MSSTVSYYYVNSSPFSSHFRQPITSCCSVSGEVTCVSAERSPKEETGKKTYLFLEPVIG